VAKVKMEEIFEKLGFQLQAALKDALKEVGRPEVSDKELYKAFQKHARLRLGAWEQVADSSVDSGY
jgi:hypothetical protein